MTAKTKSYFILTVSLDLTSPIINVGKKNKKILQTDKAPSCTLAAASSSSLHDLAEKIISAFRFCFDHCFGFYSNLNSRYDSKQAYELFADCDDIEPTNADSVKKTPVFKVFDKVGKKMLFYFDYGDSWSFIVKLKKIKPFKKNRRVFIVKKPKLVPEQYLSLEE
jgi:hypothetical protein